MYQDFHKKSQEAVGAELSNAGVLPNFRVVRVVYLICGWDWCLDAYIRSGAATLSRPRPILSRSRAVTTSAMRAVRRSPSARSR